MAGELAAGGRPTAGADVTAALAEPFDPSEVRWKPQSVKGNRALAIAYIDARCVQDRLDEVLGVEGWQDDYEVLSDGSVVCRLRVRIGGDWVLKTDVGSLSEQPDGGDRLKAAFSDALKRAAVKLGVGRYLYRLSSQWVDYDPVKKGFPVTPQLPAWARPTPQAFDRPAAGPAPPVIADARRRIAATATLAQLQAVWTALPAGVQRELAKDKDKRKAELAAPPRMREPGEDDPADDGDPTHDTH